MKLHELRLIKKMKEALRKALSAPPEKRPMISSHAKYEEPITSIVIDEKEKEYRVGGES